MNPDLPNPHPQPDDDVIRARKLLARARDRQFDELLRLDRAVHDLGGVPRIRSAGQPSAGEVRVFGLLHACLGLLSGKRMRLSEIEETLKELGIPAEAPELGRILRGDSRFSPRKKGWWALRGQLAEDERMEEDDPHGSEYIPVEQFYDAGAEANAK